MARNSEVSPYIGKLSKSNLYSKKGLYKRERKPVAPKAVADVKAPESKSVQVGGKANGQTRIKPAQRAPKFYPADDVRQPKKSRKANKTAKLRSSITPGTVLILLAGRFRGKRVVFLKQLESGLLLVTGPYKVNGVPLRRVDQAYVIATSTKVDISSVKVDDKINDAYFSKDKKSSRQGTEGEFFENGKKGEQKKELPADKAADQKTVDKAVIEAVSKVEHLSKYLGATFSLSRGQPVHLLRF